MADISRLPGPNADLWDWQLEGACRDVDTEAFFHPEGERGSARSRRELAAKAICATCPVIDDCLEFAMRKHSNVDGGLSFIDGVYGGTSYLDRRRLRQERERAVAESMRRHPSRGRGAA